MTKNQGYLLGSLTTTLANNANCCMIYTGAPQNTRRVATELLNIAQFQQNCQAHRINLKHVIVHAPYIVNLANPSKPQLFAYSVRFLSEEIARVARIGAEILVLHPGSHGGTGVMAGLQSLVTGLNQILTPDLPVKIAIETMSGRKNEIGSTFEQIKYIIQHVRYPEMVGVCWDTCHLFASNYDLRNKFDLVLTEFKVKIGLAKLWVIHINDSKFGFRSHRDRHANLGYGYIGFQQLLRIIYHPDFQKIPKILETPFVNKKSPYQAEIAMIKAQHFTHPFSELTPVI